MAGKQKCMPANFYESAGKQYRGISTKSGFRVRSQVDYSRVLDLKDMQTSGQQHESNSNSTFSRRGISGSSGLARIKTGPSNDQNNHASSWISTHKTSVTPKMQLFVRLIGTETTFVMFMPVDITIGSFIQKSLMVAGLQP